MKKLSIKQKAERYDKIIETAKSKILYSDKPCFVDINEIFPELVESEDERIRKGLIQYFSTFSLDTFGGLEPKKIISWLEKQGEQKPVENNIWTIQDAKDGDVLYDGDNACIFRKIIPDDEKVWCDTYCGINCDNDFVINKPNERWCCACDLVPATKEQRDLLFQKMKEAGYEWDAEKKELKETLKEMQKSIDKAKVEEFTDFERTLVDVCSSWIGEGNGWEQYIKDSANVLLEIAVKKFNSIQDATFEQEPAEWSEEDEKLFGSTIDNLEELKAEYGETYGDSDEFIDWLKSLKDRIIQPYNTWKPTEEQISALSIAIRCGIQIGSEEEKALRSLREQLRKLKK